MPFQVTSDFAASLCLCTSWLQKLSNNLIFEDNCLAPVQYLQMGKHKNELLVT